MPSFKPERCYLSHRILQVASILSLCASSRVAACGLCRASRTRWQASGATLLAAYACDGSRQNHPTMDGRRGALVPLAAAFRLRGIEARWGAGSCRGVMGEGIRRRAHMELALGREGLSGLLHHRKPARSGFAEAAGIIHHVLWQHLDV